VQPSHRAALEVAAGHGVDAVNAVVLQDTNNVVVWLRPHPVVAKVGVFPHSEGALAHEHAIGVFLAASGAPVASPLPNVPPTRHEGTGFTVTLWEQLQVEPGRSPTGADVGGSLRSVHDALAKYDGPLPTFRDGLLSTRTALGDEVQMRALPRPDRTLLRDAFDKLTAELDTRTFVPRALHGEPHDNNFLITKRGVRWIDFEAASVGPLEWDLASLSDNALGSFPEHDPSMLRLLRTLNSARVATWCWARAEIPEMRHHAEHHLGLVRADCA
jgi:Ser/Thr protein kinase RdoA (MazF antagonist)